MSFWEVKVYTDRDVVVPTANKPKERFHGTFTFNTRLGYASSSPDLQSAAVTFPPNDRVECTLHWITVFREMVSDNDQNASCDPMEANI